MTARAKSKPANVDPALLTKREKAEGFERLDRLVQELAKEDTLREVMAAAVLSRQNGEKPAQGSVVGSVRSI